MKGDIYREVEFVIIWVGDGDLKMEESLEKMREFVFVIVWCLFMRI